MNKEGDIDAEDIPELSPMFEEEKARAEMDQ